MTKKLALSAVVWLLLAISGASAQEFFNLTASEVRIDSVLPVFTHQFELGTQYDDYDYEVSIDYPEFIDMSKTDIARLKALGQENLPEMPQVGQVVAVARKEGILDVSFVPLVLRDGKYQKLVSFQLGLHQVPISKSRARKAVAAKDRYAAHSVLASGSWAKICVEETGVYQLSDALCRQAGFSNPSKVKIYGYGGALQPEKLTGDYLIDTDDLKEVPTCTVGGRRFFYAVGPVNWESSGTAPHKRNNYSTRGYYFLTENDSTALTVDESTFISSFYPSANDYHSLWELEEYAWFQGGRRLFARTPLSFDKATTCTLSSTTTTATLSLSMSYDGEAKVAVLLNGEPVDTITCQATVAYLDPRYQSATAMDFSLTLKNMQVGDNTIGFRQVSNTGATVRPDYAMLTFSTPKEQPDLHNGVFPSPQYVYRITNQDLHSHGQADMVIVVPTSQKLMEQALRIKQLHEQKDGLRVTVVPADELYNEFSSGTPDANAYRRYLKMLYDRAETTDDMPSYLLLFGDGAWDNRMLCSEWSGYSPDDFLLCYESDNSFSEVACFTSDDYFCLLDDREEIRTGSTNNYAGKPDVAVGRFTARTAAEAKILTDKTIGYRNNDYAGAWQNTICMMGDDGNANIHMRDAEDISTMIQQNYPGYNIKKVYWDAYNRVASSTGNGYPDVTRLLKQQMQEGALVMNYTGHGGYYTISHEQVLWRSDFAAATSMHLPLWITASCDIMPFDGQEENIGETAMLNPKGGAIAFFGTTRTVYVNYNRPINRAFMRYVLGTRKGKPISIGEAVRLAKVEMVNNLSSSMSSADSDPTQNKLQYSLLGDPALVLARPTLTAQIDSINGQPLSAGTQVLSAGQKVTVSGHIPGQESFNGRVTATVRDVEELVVCKINNMYDGLADNERSDTAFYFRDRPSTIYVGSDSVQAGRFSFTFAVPKDISYSDNEGLLLIYAVNDDRTLEAHCEQEGFVMGSQEDLQSDGVGPSIYCYLNSPSFINGSTVNATPYFYAELTDKDGINAAGSGIGHDLELIIDGEMNRTYNLNSSFQYNFGDYRSGNVGYSIPELSEGPHKLLFRAWDVFNNSSTAELSFTVDPKLEPGITVICTQNPASESTSFIISHDRTGSQMDVVLEVYDTSGRKLWQKTETGLSADNTYRLDWDLTVSSGSRLSTGVYLYRVLVSTNGSTQAQQAKKLIVIGNK